jgi:hypothetical protein
MYLKMSDHFCGHPISLGWEMMGLAIHITTIIAHFRPDLTAQICTPKDRRG